MADLRWVRITSQGKTVYWNRHLPDGRRLAVSRLSDGWRWTVYGELHTGRHPVIDAEGTTSTVSAGRKAAERAATKEDDRAREG